MIRILSVEDDVDLQRLLALALADEDFEIHYAFTGPEGFEKALALQPHVILCDLMLPIYDGRELIGKLKAENSTRDVPIVVITAHYDSATLVEEEIRKLGVIEYLRKPVRTEDLVRVIRRVAEPPRPESQPPRPRAKV
jgi:CheY-like chemotaxis protein